MNPSLIICSKDNCHFTPISPHEMKTPFLIIFLALGIVDC